MIQEIYNVFSNLEDVSCRIDRNEQTNEDIRAVMCAANSFKLFMSQLKEVKPSESVAMGEIIGNVMNRLTTYKEKNNG